MPESFYKMRSKNMDKLIEKRKKFLFRASLNDKELFKYQLQHFFAYKNFNDVFDILLIVVNWSILLFLNISLLNPYMPYINIFFIIVLSITIFKISNKTVLYAGLSVVLSLVGMMFSKIFIILFISNVFSIIYARFKIKMP